MRKLFSVSEFIFIASAVYVISFSATVNARSINDALGTTGFAWLKNIPDAAISASGECMAARDGFQGLFINPAAIADIKTRTFKTSYVSHYVDTQYGYLGYAGKFKDKLVGLKISYVDYGDFVETDKYGARTGTFTAGDMGLSLNVGKSLREDIKIGASFSYLSSKLDDFTAQAVAADFGVIYNPPFNGLTVGATLTNLGVVTKSYSKGYDEVLPVTLNIGARKKLSHAPITFFTDVIFPNDNDISYAFGIEANIRDMLFLYAGTRSASEIDTNIMKAETDYSALKTFGIGLCINRYRFNYAYCIDDNIENIQKITISF